MIQQSQNKHDTNQTKWKVLLQHLVFIWKTWVHQSSNWAWRYFMCMCCHEPHFQRTHKDVTTAQWMWASSAPPNGWHVFACQSNSSVLDVVTHFLWAGLATESGFEECGKKQCERGERKCVFISVGGAWFYTLICLQTCSESASQASEAMRSPRRPRMVSFETRTGRAKKKGDRVKCQQVLGK